MKGVNTMKIYLDPMRHIPEEKRDNRLLYVPGLVFILLGVLIIFFPALLPILAAAFFISLGIIYFIALTKFQQFIEHFHFELYTEDPFDKLFSEKDEELWPDSSSIH